MDEMIKFDPYRRCRLKNNRKETRGRRVQLIAAYSPEVISKAATSIEKLRRARSLKNIQHRA